MWYLDLNVIHVKSDKSAKTRADPDSYWWAVLGVGMSQHFGNQESYTFVQVFGYNNAHMLIHWCKYPLNMLPKTFMAQNISFWGEYDIQTYF